MTRLQKMKSPAPRCRVFPKHKIRKKGLEAYISSEEMVAVYGKLKELDSECADFYWVLCHTGLRLNEGVGLALSHIYKGEPKDKTLKKMLSRFEIKSFLHVVLDSQPFDDEKIRSKDGSVKRKPLKHKKSVGPGMNRMIPIQDKRATAILVSRFNTQAARCKKREFGEDKGNYLLFDGMNKNRISNALRKVYSILTYGRKSPHDCRHTYCTNVVAQTEGHTFLAKYVLGHSDAKTTENYMHLWELIQRQVVQEEQVEEEMDLAKILV